MKVNDHFISNSKLKTRHFSSSVRSELTLPRSHFNLERLNVLNEFWLFEVIEDDVMMHGESWIEFHFRSGIFDDLVMNDLTRRRICVVVQIQLTDFQILVI